MKYLLSSRHMALMLAPAAVLAAATAFGHTGHDGVSHGGFTSGLLHPLLGLDHLLAMAAIGLWSVRQDGALRRFAPLIMLLGMWGGAALAWSGLALSGVEIGISLSVLLSGVLVATLIKLPSTLGNGLVVLFMLFHGHSHAQEMPQGMAMYAYLPGFTLMTLSISYAGRLLGDYLLDRENRLVRMLGAAIAVAGGCFALG